MPGADFSDDDLRELHEILQSAALEAYPNPDRIGCPSRQILEQIAASRYPSNHPGYQHVATCSPCLKEMLELRSQTLNRRGLQRQNRRRWFIAAAAIVLVGLVAYWQFSVRRSTSNPKGMELTFNDSGISSDQIGRLDFSNNSGPRDATATHNAPHLQSVHSNIKELILRLPPGSEEGKYVLEIRSATTMSPERLARQTTIAKATDGSLLLKGMINLTGLSPGIHVAAWRRVNSGSWDFGSFVVE